MEKAKSDILISAPFALPNSSFYTFPKIGENTQHSVFLQKEIEEFSNHFSPRRNLTNPYSALITHRVHDQKNDQSLRIIFDHDRNARSDHGISNSQWK